MRRGQPRQVPPPFDRRFRSTPTATRPGARWRGAGRRWPSARLRGAAARIAAGAPCRRGRRRSLPLLRRPRVSGLLRVRARPRGRRRAAASTRGRSTGVGRWLAPGRRTAVRGRLWHVREQIVWAALDCPSGIAAHHYSPDEAAMVLARLRGSVERPSTPAAARRRRLDNWPRRPKAPLGHGALRRRGRPGASGRRRCGSSCARRTASERRRGVDSKGSDPLMGSCAIRLRRTGTRPSPRRTCGRRRRGRRGPWAAARTRTA